MSAPDLDGQTRDSPTMWLVLFSNNNNNSYPTAGGLGPGSWVFRMSWTGSGLVASAKKQMINLFALYGPSAPCDDLWRDESVSLRRAQCSAVRARWMRGWGRVPQPDGRH